MSETKNLESNAVSAVREQVADTSDMPRSLLRAVFFRVLDRNRRGTLEVRDAGAKRVVRGPEPGLDAQLHVLDKRFYGRCVLFGEIGFGEAYALGYWDSPEPLAVLHYFLDNRETAPTFSGSTIQDILVNIGSVYHRMLHWLRPNSKRVGRRNISDHYDLSNEFFGLWLDGSMAYSAAIFRDSTDLARAQEKKFQRIAQKLNLKPDHHLLEIGCGWGGFAIYAAQNYGCRVHGITISQQQYDFATQRVRELGLEDRIEIEIRDYRDVERKYDRIVSIEMMEALGIEYMDTFFRKVDRALKPDGIAVLQCITFPDPYYRRYLRTIDWTQIYVFPGSVLMSVREMLNSLDRTGDLVLYDLESIGPDYARTLRAWRNNFEANVTEVRALGFDDEFIRKWRYYLMFCEAGFARHYINDVQMVLSRPQNPEWSPGRS